MNSNCLICNSDKIRETYVIEETTIYKCTECGTGWWDFSSFDLSTFYEEHYFDNDAVSDGYSNYASLHESQLINARKRLKRMNHYVSNPKKILDIGCGLGYFLEATKKYGYDSAGFEMSHWAANNVREHLHIPVYENDMSSIPENYDIITAWDVIEHVPDSHAFFNACTKLLNPEGIIVITTGDFSSLTAKLSGKRWHLFNLPEHLYFFTKNSIEILAEQNNLKILKISYPNLYYPLSYIRERLTKKLGIKIPFALFDKINLPVNLMDIMEVTLAKK